MASNRHFQYLNARIHTRENSTLTVATVAASASLICFTLYVQQPYTLFTQLLTISHNPLSLHELLSLYGLLCTLQNNLAVIRMLGFVFGFLGNFYREITIFTADMKNYKELWKYLPPKKRGREDSDWLLRGVIIRVLLYLSASIWLYSPIPSTIDPLTIITQTIIAILAIFTLLPAFTLMSLHQNFRNIHLLRDPRASTCT